MYKPLDEEAIYRNPRATLSRNSKGRLSRLDIDDYRTEFQRDIHRIIYSQPFRRLRHKTQVFFLPRNDHICTRLEHVLHVAAASRTVARHLNLNEDLVEAIGLAHDLGHAPFGHHGETVLDSLSQAHSLEVHFQHEIHGLRVVDRLAELDREPEEGLNLTYEVRDGIICHRGEHFPREIIPRNEDMPLEHIKSKSDTLMPYTLEACIVRMVDRIAYAGRDIEDALVAGLIKEKAIPADVIRVLGKNNGEIVGSLLEDLITYSQANPDRVGLSEEKHQALNHLIGFNYEQIYKHKQVAKYKEQATRALEELFGRLLVDIEKTNRFKRNLRSLPKAQVYEVLKKFIRKVGYSKNDPNALIILDFISGMTDNFVVNCLDELFVPKHIT